MLVNALYTSIWDINLSTRRGYQIQTKCTIDSDTGEVEAESCDDALADDVQILDREYVAVKNKANSTWIPQEFAVKDGQIVELEKLRLFLGLPASVDDTLVRYASMDDQAGAGYSDAPINLACFDPGQYSSAAEAKESGALHELGSEVVGYAIADCLEAVSMVERCLGSKVQVVQVIPAATLKPKM